MDITNEKRYLGASGLVTTPEGKRLYSLAICNLGLGYNEDGEPIVFFVGGTETMQIPFDTFLDIPPGSEDRVVEVVGGPLVAVWPVPEHLKEYVTTSVDLYLSHTGLKAEEYLITSLMTINGDISNCCHLQQVGDKWLHVKPRSF